VGKKGEKHNTPINFKGSRKPGGRRAVDLCTPDNLPLEISIYQGMNATQTFL
jgi:hypothetical protein